MQFGLDLAQHQLGWDELLRRAHLADDSGFDAVWLFDHFTPLYGDPTGPCLESWSLLAALAAATRRVRLGTLVTGITYRPPAILATQAVTIDHVSGGRLLIGLGAAWHAREHHALGLDFPGAGERIDRLQEAIEVMRGLMTTDGASFEGRYYRLHGASFRPRPVQQPHPPIWIGGEGRRKTMPLAARVADGWHGYGRPDAWSAKARLLGELAERAGRDPAVIARAASLSLSQPWDRVRRDIEAFAAAGCTHLIVGWPTEGQSHLEAFTADVMPEFADA